MTERLAFSNPQEELAYLRTKVLEAEKQLESRGEQVDREAIIRDSIRRLKDERPEAVEKHAPAAHEHAASLAEQTREIELGEMMQVAGEKGVLYALSVVEKLKGWRLEDDFHDFLVGVVKQGLPVSGLKEKGPIYKALHMTLYEVILPKGTGKSEKPLTELIRSMEQLYAGFLSVAGDNKMEANYMVFELANPEGAEDTHAFVSVPTSKKSLFEKQLLSIFPSARLDEREHDYNIFNEAGEALGASASLTAHGAYPLKTFEQFGEDPMSVILNGFTKIPREGSGAGLQIVFRPAGNSYTERYNKALGELLKGKKAKAVLKDQTLTGEVLSVFFGGNKKKKDTEEPPIVDQAAADAVREKVTSPIVEANIRLCVSAPTKTVAQGLMEHFQSAFNQFENSGRQALKWQNTKASKESDFYRAFTFRLFRENEALPLNLKELSTMLHFHTEALIQNTPLTRLSSRGAPPPISLAKDGVLLGVNRFQGTEKNIYIKDEDRLRHFYTIGQTGTGKSTLLKNMIMADIERGEGVCFVDPHGSDVLDILASVPPERARDVIYFDPSDTERPMGLNMLEYNHERPDEKTFVVNELFGIFQKLYGGVPESMGPMFEQYFRNATMLVIEHPESGSTLLDVSRVLSNKAYRELKLSHCKNPIVVQFWREVAEKAGGEAALANIVPYITSKFDVFLANDVMRPIVASERTAFNMRQVMDEKKILLVNLSKGRLGDINANLLGLILVGKILMAALSRVDSAGRDLPPFYLYLDEFQSITTNSIATILSEARKYKLSLTLAHQFIAQLEENIKDAVFGNVGSICAFRVGSDDAQYLENQFAPVFTADDLMNVDNRKAYLRMLVNGRPVEPFDIETLPPKAGDKEDARQIIALSRERYGRPRAEVEQEVLAKYQ